MSDLLRIFEDPDELEPIARLDERLEREVADRPDLLPEYGMVRCECGRLRLTFGGEVAGPCIHAP